MKTTSESEYLKSRLWTDAASEIDINNYISNQPQDKINEKVLPALQNWHCCGYTIIRNAIPEATINQFLEEIDHIRSNHKRYDFFIDGTVKHYTKKRIYKLKPEELNDVGLKLCGLHSFSPAAVEISMNPYITRFLQHVFKAPPALLQSLMFNKSSEQGVHQDFSFVFNQREVPKLAACWVALEDIHADAGPLEYFKKSHLLNSGDFFDWGGGSVHVASWSDFRERGINYDLHLKRQISEKKWEREIFLPRKGDVLMWHGALIHAGTAMRNPNLTRKSFVCHYTPLDSHPDSPRPASDGYIFTRATKRVEDAMMPKSDRSEFRLFLGRLKRAFNLAVKDEW